MSSDTVGVITGPGDFAFEVVGESRYQDALEMLVATCGDHGHLEAHLVLENSNPHDPNAVQVQILGEVCGYLSRQHAEEYRNRLHEAGLPEETFKCVAMIVGKGPFGLRLDLPHDGTGTAHDSWRDDPATDRQRAFADDLGIFYNEDITKGELSDLIAEAIKE